MKNRSELREIIMKIIYQVNMFEESKLDYNLNDLIKEQLEVENDFVNETIDGIIKNKEKILERKKKWYQDKKIKMKEGKENGK